MDCSNNIVEDPLTNAIKFYQSGLDRYRERKDELKMLHSLNKLSRYPIKVCHLKETGVGRTVNNLVKMEGKVGEEAYSLINKWKKMVEKESDIHDSSGETSENSPQNQQCEKSSKSRHSKHEHSSSERKTGSDEGRNKNVKSQAEKENRAAETHKSSKEHRSNDHKKHESSDGNKEKSSHDRRDNKHTQKDHKKHESSDGNKEKSSHDRRDNKHTQKDERDKHSSRREKHESSSKEKVTENDKRREKERDRTHRENGDKSTKEKNDRKEVDHKSRKDKDRSSHREKDERHRKDNDRTHRKEKEDKTHRNEKRNDEKNHKDKKNEDRDKKSSSSSTSIKDQTSSSKNDEKNHKDKKNEDRDKKSSSSSTSIKDKTSSSNNRSIEISSGSGTSFADALGKMDVPRTQKKSDKKETTSSSKHHKSDTVPAKEKKTDRKESSSSSKHNKVEKSPESLTKKDKKPDKKDSSRHHKSEISSESGTSFEDALKMMEMPKKGVKRDRSALYDSEICSSSGTSFEAALGMMEIPRKKKKLSVGQVENTPSPTVSEKSPVMPLPTEQSDNLELISSLLPSITPHYRPLTVLDSKHPFNEQATLNSFMTNKHQRTKIYSGNKSSHAKIPSLFDNCVQLLQNHIDAIEGTGGVPYSILKPVLEKATPPQLLRLEYFNSYLTEDSDELWKLHCLKDFRREKRQECETWRDMYNRCTEERELRLQVLTDNIKLSRAQKVPVKQTKIAYIDPPNRNSSRKQVKHTSSAPMAKAKVESIMRDSKASSDVVVTHQVRAARGSSSSSGASSSAGTSSSQAKIVKKVAPLMAKSLSAFKNRFRR